MQVNRRVSSLVLGLCVFATALTGCTASDAASRCESAEAAANRLISVFQGGLEAETAEEAQASVRQLRDVAKQLEPASGDGPITDLRDDVNGLADALEAGATESDISKTVDDLVISVSNVMRSCSGDT